MGPKLDRTRRGAVDRASTHTHTHTEQRLTVGVVQLIRPRKVKMPPMPTSFAPPKSQLVITLGTLSQKLSPPPPLPPPSWTPASPRTLAMSRAVAATAAAVRRRMEVFIVGGMPGTRYRLARMSKVLFPVVVDAARQSKQQ